MSLNSVSIGIGVILEVLAFGCQVRQSMIIFARRLSRVRRSDMVAADLIEAYDMGDLLMHLECIARG